MRSKSQVVPISNIVEDKGIYPRCNWGWQTAYDYAMSMKSGAVFPPIVLASLEGKLVLLDGKHRLEAYKQNKEKYVQCDVRTGLSRKAAYLLAIELNIANSRPLTTQDKVMNIVNLRKMKFSDPQISKIVFIPVGKIENFVVHRITNTLTGEQVILKAPAKNMAGVPVQDGFNEDVQNIFSTTGQMSILDQMIRLVESNVLNLSDRRILEKSMFLRKLLSQKILKKRKGK